MRVPRSWLEDFVDIVLPDGELAERMTFAGLEVSALERIGDFWDREKILVGEVIGVEPHPNADRLTVAEVDYGSGRRIKVVTGAPNIKVGHSGDKVPLALAGSLLVDGYAGDGSRSILKKAKIRGVASEGMICSEKELDLSEEHQGIMNLPVDAPVGSPLVDYLGETVFELDLTPNLSRCLSILGVAREVSALTGQALNYRRADPPEGSTRAEEMMRIEIADPELSARYCGTYIGGIAIGPSPFVMRMRLMAAGMRPINNVVDITNYVMLELGQPLHAFDYALLRERAGGKPPEILVRPALPGEKLTTLDGVERVCTADTLLITDSGGPIAIAGVMGGLETEVLPETKEVLLESANFNHASIRRTSSRFKLPSQASLRFGKGIPPSLSHEAVSRATALMAEQTGGSAAAGVVDCYPKKQTEVTVRTTVKEFEKLLGYRIPKKRITAILDSLEFSVDDEGSELEVRVPEHRLDVSIPADLVEEVVRLEGYEKLPATLMKDYLPPQSHEDRQDVEEMVKGILVGSGLEEVINYSLVNEERAAWWDGLSESDLPGTGVDFLRLANPLSEDRTVMRVSLIPGLLENLLDNRRFLQRVAIFECGRIYRKAGGAERPREPSRLAILLWGRREDSWWGKPQPDPMDFFDLKGLIGRVLQRLGLDDHRLEASSRPCLEKGRGVEVFLGETALGCFGELSTDARGALDLREERVSLAEIDLDALVEAWRIPAFSAPGRFPPVIQDIALVVDEDLPAEKVEQEIRAAGGRLLAGVTLFDIYRGSQIPGGKKSLAFSLVFQAEDRTLVEEEASRQREKIQKALHRRLGASLRGQ
jgi:phenylalanyl-tRNA synthetase beta chain